MQLKKINISDLDYLAELGINSVQLNEADISDLKLKIKNRSVSYNSGSYFYFICLIVGIFIGVSVFFTMYNAPHNYSSKFNTVNENKVDVSPNTNASIILDTINVVHENFVKTPIIKSQVTDTLLKENEVINNIEVSTMPILTLPQNNISEAQIKYFANSSLFYLHDLKITDYSNLYFKLNKFVALNTVGGLSAAYSNKEEYMQTDNLLNDVKPYYLHQAIADALLKFKIKKYDECLMILKDIMSYNSNDINCKFYYGMCLYNKKNYTEAIKYFDYCISNANNSFLQEAEYYKALSLYESANVNEANKLFSKIANEAGFYADKAKQYK